MDYRIVLSILLIAHFLGDFYFQSDTMVKKKNDKCLEMIGHGLIYASCVFFLTFLMFGDSLWLYPLLISASHLLIDIAKSCLLKCKCTKKHPVRLFFADQALHIAIIAVIAYYYATGQEIAYSPLSIKLQDIYNGLQVKLPASQLIRIVGLFLFVGKPAGIITATILETFKNNRQSASEKDQKLWAITGDIAGKEATLHLHQQSPESTNTNSTDQKQKAGRYIGILERYLTVIFFLLNQYTAIAFTLTAKSIARFKELEKADFAEQYLIGTLVSLLLAVLSALILCG